LICLQMFFIFMEKQKNQTLVCFSSILIKVARASKKIVLDPK